MKKIIQILLLAFTGFLVFPQENETSRKRYALVVGNQRYQDFPLKNCVNDAELIADSLASKEFDVTFKKNLTGLELKAVIDSYIEKVNSDPRAVSLVYLTGHGFAYKTEDNSEIEKNYFVPVDNGSIHSSDEAINFSLDIEKDLASKIKTAGQIYIIDGAYDNPFKVTGTRALGVKGGLSQVKSARESTVGFLFSAAPGTVVKNHNETVSVFAKSVKDQIDSSKDNLDQVFSAIKTGVSSKTNGEQNPYSSATTLKFAFNGDELTALKKNRAIAMADKTSIDSIEMSRRYQSVLAERAKRLAEADADAEISRLSVSEEVIAKRKAQKEEDMRRAAEEAERAQSRSAEANSQIMALREEFETSAEELKDSMKKNAAAEERLNYIEEMKSNLSEIRSTGHQQIYDYFAMVDKETEDKVNQIDAKEYTIVELKDGLPTELAIKRRTEKKEKFRTEDAARKSAYKKQKENQIAEDDRKWLPQIKSAYSKLEGDTYVVTSLEDEMTYRVDDYDGSVGKWKLHVSADLFGKTDIFSDDIYLGYKEVTGKKNIDVSTMTDSQFQEYNDDVEVYDALFKSSTQVFYVKLYYKIYKWRYASEYHFVPKKCEIIRLGKKNKVIQKIYEKEFDTAEFSMSPAVDIRTGSERIKDIRRADRMVAAEKKLREEPVKKVNYSSSSGKKSSVEISSSCDSGKSSSYESSSSYSSGKKSSYSSSYSSSKTKEKIEKEKKEKTPRVQIPVSEWPWGRNGFFVTGNFGFTDMYKTEYFQGSNLAGTENPSSYGLEIHINCNMFGAYYWGFSGGFEKYDYKQGSNTKLWGKDQNDITGFLRFSNGFGICIGPYVRPYIEGGVFLSFCPYNFKSYGSSYSDEGPGRDSLLGFDAGTGLDFIIGKRFMVTAGVSYNWMYFFRTFRNGVLNGSSSWITGVSKDFWHIMANPDFHMVKFSVGLGINM